MSRARCQTGGHSEEDVGEACQSLIGWSLSALFGADSFVTLKDIVAGRVSLEIEAFDWIYLNGRVSALQNHRSAGGMAALAGSWVPRPRRWGT